MTERLLAEFPPIATSEWEQALTKDLKGSDPKKLIWNTEDGIAVRPFYRADDIRTASPVLKPGGGGKWEIRAEIAAPSIEAALVSARAALDGGAEGLVFRDLHIGATADFNRLLSDLPLDRISVSFMLGEASGKLVELLNASPYAQRLRGSVDGSGPLPAGFRTLIRADRFCAGGATRVQELAFALAAGVEHLADFGPGAPLAFLMPIGSSYFSEIAKLRAARLLWASIAEAFGAGVQPHMWIDARTSAWNQTIYDPHVNTLRSTTEAMSAIFGGCDSLVVLPFTGTWQAPDELSSRLAINTQLILRDEAQFERVADPGAGCWFLEDLTDQLAQKAWDLFQQVERQGGFRKAVAAGFVADLVAASNAERSRLIAQRRRVFVGTNQYPDPRERSGMADVPEGRGAVAFEKLRVPTERSGRIVRAQLLTRGDPKMRRARAEFVANFLGCAGFESFESSSIESGDADLIVLCSSDAEYPALAAEVVPQAQVPVLIAGPPQDIPGIADFIHIRSNALDVLTSWQQKLGIAQLT